MFQNTERIPFLLDALGEKLEHFQINEELAAFRKLKGLLKGSAHQRRVADVEHAFQHQPGIVDSHGELNKQVEQGFNHRSCALAHHGNQLL